MSYIADEPLVPAGVSEPEWLYQIGKIKLSPEDILLLRVNTGTRLSRDQMSQIKEVASQVVGKDQKILVVDGCIEVAVIQRGDDNA